MIESSSSPEQEANGFCLIWRREGGTESFRHIVTAKCLSQAVELSRLEVHRALASNSVFWILQQRDLDQFRDVEHASCGKPQTGPLRRSLGFFTSVLLSLGLIIILVSLHHQSSRPNAADKEGAPPLMPIPASTVPTYPVDAEIATRSFPGLVVTTKIIDVRAPCPGHITPLRPWRIGDRLIEGQVIAEYDPPSDAVAAHDIPESCGEYAISAPVTATVIDAAPVMPVNVQEGVLLLRLAREADFRISASMHLSGLDSDQACYVWKAGAFISLAEIVTKQTPLAPTLSLRFLDQFAAVTPGMTVVVQCTRRQAN